MSADEIARDIESENAVLREQLAEAQSVIHAIQRGEVDAVIVDGPDGERVFTLEGADHPYRVLVESMNEGATTLDQNGVVLYSNPRLAALLGVSSEALRGSCLHDRVVEPDKTTLRDMIDRCASEAVSGELALTTSDGAEVPVRISLNELGSEGERRYCAVITDQRDARHRAALEAAANSVRDANARLREADKRKDVFLATLAHELRNPLAPIRAAASVLEATSSRDERQLRACSIIERQVTHMTRLVDDLLEVSRITLGRLQVERRPENLTAILTAVVESVRSSALTQELTVDLTDSDLPIYGDEVRLSQAISNVVENAVKYTPAGGRIVVSARRELDHCVVRVGDNGIGISPEALPAIFEMFTQEVRPQKLGSGGLGIGLALTRSIIGQHGGTIEASSPGVDRGSEFVIRLPLERRAEPAHAAEARPPDIAGREILVVDDNADAADMLCMTLELAGHTARAVYRGREVSAALEDFDADIVLLDIGLPDMDGYEVAKRLRERLGEACPKLVALSGWGRDEDKARATKAGIDLYLSKPVSLETLRRLVAEN